MRTPTAGVKGNDIPSVKFNERAFVKDTLHHSRSKRLRRFREWYKYNREEEEARGYIYRLIYCNAPMRSLFQGLRVAAKEQRSVRRNRGNV